MIRRIILALVTAASVYANEPHIPSEAVALLPDAPSTPTVAKPEFGKIERLPSTDALMPQIFRATSQAKLEKSYELALNKRFTGAIAKDQVCLFVVKARTLESEREDGKGKITCVVQNTKDYKATVLWKTHIIGREWETNYFAFAAGSDVPEGAGSAKITIGEQKQTIEVADIQVYRFPLGFDIFNAPQMKKTYEGREPDAPWRKEAEARIAKLRQGKLNIVVRDAAGSPVEGAKVTVRMKRHLFGFGSAVDVNMLSGLSSKISAEDQIKYRNTVDELFSRMVPESGLRVGNIEGPTDPAKPWEANTRLRTKAAVQWTLQWAMDKKMTSRGHYLSWGYLEPWAAEEVKKGGPSGLLERYAKHWAFVLPLAAPYVDEWDALNHPVPFVESDALYNVIGPSVYSDIYAKIRPLTDKLLFVNEDAFNPERVSGFEKHIDAMIAKGQKPDGCGFQSHFSDYAIPSIENEWGVYQNFGSKVKHLTVTEYDFQTLDDQLHADHMRDMLTLSYSHPQMTGFVIWGFWEKRHWKPTAAMFKADWTERPAVKVWRDLVKGKWWTNAELTSASDGTAATPGYFGWYDITIEHGGKSKSFEIKHSVNGSKPVLKLD